MAILKFRVYLQEDDSIYRDISVYHKQNFTQFHHAILSAFEFDNKHQSTFYRSNDLWQKGKEITFEKYEKDYVVAPLLMHETLISSQIFNTTQKFIYQYDFTKNWFFHIELINVSKEESNPNNYPLLVRKEGLAPSQYGTKGLMGTGKLTEVEEKYDLSNLMEGFNTKDDDGNELLGEEELGVEGEEESQDQTDDTQEEL
jgi:Plasmid pRiA4b ORF-3-like protein